MTVVAAVPLALAGWSAIRISQSVTREQIGDAHQRLAENLAESVKAFDVEEVQSLATAARAFDFEHLSPEERRGAHSCGGAPGAAGLRGPARAPGTAVHGQRERR